ncbi:MAG: divergent polysaccharide deacetylase family protein [Alphaproteobacteria bacterium]|nr:divergent polysaccharide deacetylase family protein [Alphaproteobacteria bacterium]
MGKKRKKKAAATWGKGLVVALVIAAMAGLWFYQLGPEVPHTKWRVPVRVEMPKGPDLSGLSIPSVTDLKDVPSFWQDMRQWKEDLMSPPPTGPEAEPSPALPPPVKGASPRGQVPLPQGEGRGEIAIIIDDMGLNAKNAARAVRLPAFVTLSYLPYASGLEAQTKAAAAAGHESMLHLPMEAVGGENPGPCALKTGQGAEQWTFCLDKALDSFEGFAGVNNHMGSKFTADQEGMAFVTGVLHSRGLYFVDSRTSSESIAQQVAEEQGVRTVGRDVFLDDTVSAAAIQGQLARLEQVVRRKGYAVAIGHPHAATLEALEAWIPQAQARGFRFVPASALVR